MAKVLTDKEMIDIIIRAPQEIDYQDSYLHFLECLAELITTHFGGDYSPGDYEKSDGLDYIVCFNVNECVPDDGGVFKKYNTDVTWKDGIETQV